MALFTTFWQGFTFAVGLQLAMILLAVFGGGLIDLFEDRVLDMPGHDSDFVEATNGTESFIMNLFYTSLVVISLFGWVVCLQSIFAKASSSRYLGG